MKKQPLCNNCELPENKHCLECGACEGDHAYYCKKAAS